MLPPLNQKQQIQTDIETLLQFHNVTGSSLPKRKLDDSKKTAWDLHAIFRPCPHYAG